MRVLFVVKEYLPKPTPPGLCIMNVQKALLDRGIHSDVLMAGDKEGLYSRSENGDIFSIKSSVSFEKKSESAFRYLQVRIPMLFTWPVPSMKRVYDYRRVIRKLNKERKYAAIIGTMFPPDVCVACSVFDHFFLYELDSLINNPMYKAGIKKYFTPRLNYIEKKLFNRAELIIHLNNNKKFYSKNKYKKYSSKSVYTDIPNLLDESINLDEMIENKDSLLMDIPDSKVLLVYSGHLSREYRPPWKLIELVKGISKYMDIECLFFSRGDCEDELRKAETDTDGIIKRMGYVSQKVLKKYMDRADFFLDIGNCLSGEDYSLPSKLICYMAMGKPIIHMNGVNDSAIEYLEKYGLSITVRGDIQDDEAQKEVLEFIKNKKGERLRFEHVAKKFPQNTPEYTADLIMKQIEKRTCL